MALSKIPFGAGVAALAVANAGVVYWWFMQGPAAHEPLPPVLQWLDPHRQPAIDQSSVVELSAGVSAAVQAFVSLTRAARSDSSVAPSVPTAAVAAVLQQIVHVQGAVMSASDAAEAAAALDVFDSGQVPLLVLASVATLLQETRPSNAGAAMWQVFETAGIVQPALGMDRQTWWQFVMQLPANAMEVHAATGVLFPPDADTEYVNRARTAQLCLRPTPTHALHGWPAVRQSPASTLPPGWTSSSAGLPGRCCKMLSRCQTLQDNFFQIGAPATPCCSASQTQCLALQCSGAPARRATQRGSTA